MASFLFDGKISDRVADISPSQTLAIDTLAKKLIAEGEDVINFSVGEPDFPTPSNVVRAAKEALENEKNFKYSPVAGLPKLREAVSSKTAGNFSINNVLITNGGKQAVFEVFATLINSGDEVLLPSPYWLTYSEVVRFFGGKSVPIDIQTILDGSFNPSGKAKVIVINSPNNPSGMVYNERDLKKIAQFAIEHQLIVVSDEIYKYLYFEGDMAPTIIEVCPEIAEQLVIIDGVAKSAAMTGWRVGWVVAPELIINKLGSLQSQLTSNVNNIAQQAAIEAVLNSEHSTREMKSRFLSRRDLVIQLLGDLFEFEVPQGAFYIALNISKYLNVPLGENAILCQSANDFAKLLLEQLKIATVPMEAFGQSNFIRISYALSESQIKKGIGRLVDFIRTAKTLV